MTVVVAAPLHAPQVLLFAPELDAAEVVAAFEVNTVVDVAALEDAVVVVRGALVELETLELATVVVAVLAIMVLVVVVARAMPPSAVRVKNVEICIFAINVVLL